MALEKAFQELTTRLRKLRDALMEVRLTVVEDRPVTDEAVLVDHFEYGIEDVLGWLEDGIKHAAEAEQAVGVPLDLDRARRGLSHSQEWFQRAEQRYFGDLVSYVRIEELTSFGRQRRREWQGWAESVKKGLEHCRPAMEETSQALIRCWQELAERLGTMNVSVHTTNIGQQITPAASLKEVAQTEVS
jgi:hypothetical protein